MTEMTANASKPARKLDRWDWLNRFNILNAGAALGSQVLLYGNSDGGVLKLIGAAGLLAGLIAYDPKRASEVEALKSPSDAEEFGSARDEIATARARHAREIEEIVERMAKPASGFAL